MIIETHDLSKNFEDVLAVDRISFDVREGEIFGFLGPNGAGKTTTIKLLTGLARPTSGSAKINGVDVVKNPKSAQGWIGVVPDESNLYPELTGSENLSFCGALYGMARKERIARSQELLKMFDLADASARKFSTYSKGMKRKLTIAAGIIHHPPILFLDEPTTGIDVTSARQIRKLILDLRQNGVTIMLTTHYIEEAERLCDRIGFIVKGRIIRIDSVSNLLQPVLAEHKMIITLSEVKESLLSQAKKAFPEDHFILLPGNRLRVISLDPIPLSAIVHFLENLDITILEAIREKPSLEDVFVRLTGIAREEMLKDKGNTKR